MGLRENEVARMAVGIVKQTVTATQPKGDPLVGMLGLIAVEIARSNDLRDGGRR